MSLEWEQVVVDSSHPRELGFWWANALGWEVISQSDVEVEIRPSKETLPGLIFVPVTEQKTTKNRLHLDFRPDDRAAEVERMLTLGARTVDIGQGDQTWTVLADPEGNEFCILGART
ncbi:VOC family protein [Marisediminicola sp. LYQ85]|uniref:VOC family protein n=1 Tax=Marisediminicola sp. LYQ85 TaxID=3391062 RepID=UPI003983BB53